MKKYSKEQRKRILIVISAAVAALAVVVAVSCFIAVKVSQSSLKGEWKSDEEKITYEFKKKDEISARFDNSVVPVIETEYSGELTGEYLLNKSDKTLVITLNYYNKKLTQKYSFEIKNNCLALKNLEDGKTSVFYRQEK